MWRVLGLRKEGYSTLEIAQIMGWDVRQIQRLLKWAIEELSLEVELSEKTERNQRATRELLIAIRMAPPASRAQNQELGRNLDREVGDWTSSDMVRAPRIAAEPGALRNAETAPTRVAAFREKWFQAATCTEPADRARAETAIVRLYSALNLSAPRFVWCSSPMTAQIALCVLGRRRCSRRTESWRSLEPALRDALGDAARPSPLGIWLGDALQPSGVCLEDVLGDQREDWRRFEMSEFASTRAGQALGAAAMENPLWGSLRALVLLESVLVAALSRSLQASELPYQAAPSWVRLDAGLIEIFLFHRDVLRVRYAPPLSERLDWWADLVHLCMWWWPYSRICLVSERPAEIHVLNGRRLHNDTGPAVRFCDGWSIWAIDGVLVDEQVVLHPETQNLRQIRRERDAEVKRIRIERYGWDRYLAEVGARVIDRRRNDIEATRETLLRGPDSETVLVCACPSTARIYALQVPPEIQTCQEAQAWLSAGLAGRVINGA
jgi:hypothetical protein